MSKNYSSPVMRHGNFVMLPRVAAFMRSVGVLKSTAALMFLTLCLALGSNVTAQTTLINPAGDGGFETGAGFAANGWTVTNGAFNTWQSSGVGTPSAGVNHAFISNDGGATYGYSNVSTSANHFFRDVVVPGPETIITLSFMYKNVGETGWDRVLVYAAPNTVVPAAGIPASNGTALSGATLVYTGGGAIAAYTATGNITIPASFAGTTMRLIFVWQNDGGGGTSPGGAVDNISLTSAPPATFATSAMGGLWSSPASWAGGVVPANGNDINVVAGSTLTVDASTYAPRDILVNGLLNFGGTAATNFNLTVSRDLTVAVGGTMLAHNAAVNQSTGTGINLGRDMHINGTANLACLNLTCNGAGATGVAQTIDGTGTIYGNGGKGLIRALLAANLLGTVTINTTQTLVAYSAMAATGVSSFITNNKFEANLAANFDGQAINRQVYEVVMTGHGAGYTSAPTVTIATPTGGVAATATANWDAVSLTVRSITVVTGGDGYFNTFNPTITLAGGGFTTAATAIAVVPSSTVHGAANLFLAQRGTHSVITGTMPATSNDGVVSITTSNGLTGAPVASAGQGYGAAPTVGFSGPTGVNLVTAMGGAYTGAPTAIAVGGATNISGGGYVLADFTYVVQDGKLVSCYLNNQTKTYDVAPTITLTIPGGAGATVAFPAGCWPAATPIIGGPNGMITNFTVTNAGFGYRATPAVGLLGGGFTTAAVAFARCGFYALNYVTFTPPGFPTAISEGPEMPASRMLFQSTFNNFLASTIALTGGLTFIGGAPLTLTSGTITLNGGNLVFANPAYAGATGSLLGKFRNIGYVELNLPGTAATTRTAPTGTGIAMANGANTVAFLDGPTITRYRVTACTPGGATAIGNYGYTVQCFDAVGNPGIYGLNPVTTLTWNHDMGLVTDQASLTVSQGTSCAGPWTVRSLGTGTGALAATGTRATASPAAPGPWVPSGTGTDYFAFTSLYVPVALNYDVTRTTGIVYNSIIGLAGTTHWMGSSNDEGSNAAMNMTGTTFTYDGLPITTVTQHANGYIGLTGFTVTGSAWFNNTAASKRVLAPFWDDLISPAAAPVPANGYGAHRVDGVIGSGTAVITFEWKNMETFVNPGPNLNFQIKLYEAGNNIEFIYGVMQGFDGTISTNGAYAYSYSSGISNVAVNANNPQPGQVLAQNEENTRNFGARAGMVNNRGQNYMSSMPECFSSILFTPGAYTPYVPGSGVPINDDPAGAIPLTSLLGPPVDLCGTYYSSKGGSLSAVPLPVCDLVDNNADDDVWFSFQCINSTSTVKVYSSGGYNAYVQIFADNVPGTLSGVVGAQVFCQNAAAEGATETVNATGLTVGHYYYVRVFHRRGGVQATATAVVNGGVVTAINVVNPGSGYHQAAFGGAAPFQYATPRIDILGIGNNAVAQVAENSTTLVSAFNVEAGPVGGITQITVMNGGAGYGIPPTVKIAPPNAGTTGDFAITIFATPVPPSNDDICTAINVVPAYSCTLVAGPPSSVATPTNPPASCGGLPDDDVWFSFVAVSGYDHVEIDGNGTYNAHLEMFSTVGVSCLPGDLTSFACINATGAGGTEVFDGNGLNLIPGNTYFVRVYHTGTGAASGSYSYCITTPPCDTPGITGFVQTVTGLTNITTIWASQAMATSYNWEIVPLGNGQGVGVIQSGSTGGAAVAIAGLTQDTQYTLWVQAVCPLGNGFWTPFNVSTAYCPSAATLIADEDIWNVTLGTLNNTSTCATTGGPGSTLNLYSNYTSVPAPMLAQATNYTMDVYVGSCGGNFTTSVAVFIDLDEDGVLDGVTERVLEMGPLVSSNIIPGTLFSGTLNLPVDCINSGTTRMRVVAVETGDPANIDPCGTYLWGETEDYTIDIIPPTACIGAPPILTVSSDANPACVGSTITLSVPPIVACGISYQWEESTGGIGGPYLPVGTDSPNYSTTFTAPVHYRCQVTCSAGPTTTQSTILGITVNTDQCVCGAYCANPTSTFTCDEYIGNVTFATINNNSPVCLGHYEDYTGISTNITAGGTYAMSVSNGGAFYASDQVTAFFDWNINGIWNEAGESFVLTNVGGTGALFQGNIAIPCTATPGISRLRIRMNFGVAPLACLNQSWGEAEDYCVNVLAGTACAGIPAPGATSSTLASVCNFNPFTLSINPIMTDCGLTYQWQRSVLIGGPYLNIGGATTQAYTTTQSSAFFYRCEVTCTNSGMIGYSTPLQVTMNPLYSCLCVSQANFTADEDIWNVSIANLNNGSGTNAECALTGGPGSLINQYSNYTALPAPSLTRSQLHNFCVTIGTCGGSFTTSFKIFFDWNQDGDLGDLGEEAYVSSAFPSAVGGTTFNGSILVPATASLGVTAMRVVCVETGFPAGIVACGTYGWGETEDYAVNIIGAISNDDWTTAQVTPVAGGAYPAGNCYAHTLVGCGESPQGNPANVSLCTGGADRWYSFVAQSSAYRVTCTSAAFDVVLEMTNSVGGFVDAEDVWAGNGENMVTTGLTVGNVYKVGVRSENGAVGAYNVCIQAVMASTCDDGPGVYALCTNFKPDYTGATNYTFNFVPTVPTPGVPTSVTHPSQTTLSNVVLALQYGGTYDVTIDGNFIFNHADGSPDNITVPGTTVCPISIIAQPNVQVKLEQRCTYPATLLKGSIISGKPFVCGALNYTVSAQQYTTCTGGATIGLPITGTTTGASSTINLTQVNVGGTIQGGGKYYEITWTPNMVYGPGVPTVLPVRIFVGGPVMEEEINGPVAEEKTDDMVLEANLYPNPNTGDMVNLNIANVESDNVFVKITDMNGRIVYQNRYTVEGSLSTIVTFAQPLANGVYNVQFIMDNEMITRQLIVQK